MKILENLKDLNVKLDINRKFLEIAENRLEELEQKFLFPTNDLSSIRTNTNLINYNKEKYIDLTSYTIYKTIESNDYTLLEYIDYMKKEVNNLEFQIFTIESKLKELTGREYKLYYLIKVEGMSPTKAVEELAKKENLLALDNIWRKEYRKIKKFL